MSLRKSSGSLLSFSGSDVVGRAPDFAPALGLLLGQQREAEIGDLGGVGVGKEDVARLHVAVDQAALVGGVEAAGDLQADLEHLQLADARLELHEVVERALVDEFHGDVILPMVAAEGEHFHHVRDG